MVWCANWTRQDQPAKSTKKNKQSEVHFMKWLEVAWGIMIQAVCTLLPLLTLFSSLPDFSCPCGMVQGMGYPCSAKGMFMSSISYSSLQHVCAAGGSGTKELLTILETQTSGTGVKTHVCLGVYSHGCQMYVTLHTVCKKTSLKMPIHKTKWNSS